MKKLVIILAFIITIPNIQASSGRLVSASIVTCNGNTYGYHSSDKHWHEAKKNTDGSYNAIGISLGQKNPCEKKTTIPEDNDKLKVTLSSCVDGDTAKFNTNKGVESTRFLAIDTPEYTTKKEDYGYEASRFTCNKLKTAHKIVLEFDKNSTKYDKYNRLLAWIWVDGVLLQDEIIKNGLGEVAYLYGDYKYTPLLEDHEAVAKAQKLNIWQYLEIDTPDKVDDLNNTSSVIENNSKEILSDKPENQKTIVNESIKEEAGSSFFPLMFVIALSWGFVYFKGVKK